MKSEIPYDESFDLILSTLSERDKDLVRGNEADITDV